MNIITIREKKDKASAAWYCYAEITKGRGVWPFKRVIARTPPYPAVAMVLGALAEFDRKSKILTHTKSVSGLTRHERRQSVSQLLKNLITD